MIRKHILPWIALAVLMVPNLCAAHTPVLMCEADAGLCECKGMFSDMSSAAGHEIVVKNDAGKVLLKKKLNDMGEISFAEPVEHYMVILNCGPGHVTDPWSPDDH